MNILNKICFSLFLIATASYAFSQESQADLNEFNEVGIESTQLSLVMKEEGMRFACTIGDSLDSETPEYGDTILLPFDQKCRLSSRHYVITFSPLPDDLGFLVTKTIDNRSLGGDIHVITFKVISVNGNLTYVN